MIYDSRSTLILVFVVPCALRVVQHYLNSYLQNQNVIHLRLSMMKALLYRFFFAFFIQHYYFLTLVFVK